MWIDALGARLCAYQKRERRALVAQMNCSLVGILLLYVYTKLSSRAHYVYMCVYFVPFDVNKLLCYNSLSLPGLKNLSLANERARRRGLWKANEFLDNCNLSQRGFCWEARMSFTPHSIFIFCTQIIVLVMLICTFCFTKKIE